MSYTVLVGVDGSDTSLRAMEFAIDMVKAKSGKLLLSYIIEWSPFTFNTAEENAVRRKRREEEINRANNDVLEPLLATIRPQGIEVEGMVRHGKPVQALASIADEYSASLIVAGRRGDSKIVGITFGSTTNSLLQLAKVPVVVVP